MHGPLVSNAPPLGSRKKKIPDWEKGSVYYGTAGIDWWILFNILKEDEVNQPKDKNKRSASRRQKSASKIQREKKQDKKKRREAEQREAFQ